MKKTLAALAILTCSSPALARGVYLNCISAGSQFDYATDGEYIHSTKLVVSGKDLSIQTDSEECIMWDFPEKCVHEIKTEDGQKFKVELGVETLKQTKEGHFDFDILTGSAVDLATKKEYKLVCVREPL